MSCCTLPLADTGRLFSRLAPLHRLRFKLAGFEKTQRQLIEGIQAAGLAGAELLEIGAGAGNLHRALLKGGAARATGVDLSEGMLAEARNLAHAEGLTERTDYRQGDFVQIAEDLDAADITILDKVVCCYPDWRKLIDRSLDRTRRVYALTYPRDRWLTRVGVALTTRVLKLMGSSFRPYVHDPRSIEQRIAARGFRLAYAAQTQTWLTQVYTCDGE